MEKDQSLVLKRSNKRKVAEEDYDVSSFSIDNLNQDLLETVLSWLPTANFFRLASVSKRWRSAVASKSFRLACSQVPSRDPWFFMVNPCFHQSIVFDTTERNWKNLNYPLLLQQKHNYNSIPVTSSGGLVCFRNISGNFIVCNPVTGTCRQLPPLYPPAQTQTLHAISMSSSSKSSSSYTLILVFGDFPNFTTKVFQSGKDCWDEETMLSRTTDDTTESDIVVDETLYFLSKAGDVVTTNMQRSPSKQYSSVTTVENGEDIVYFLSSSGTVIACNLAQKFFFELPRLLPVFLEYSIDVVECRGELLVVVLSEFLESASLRVWKFSKENQSWSHVAVMPPSLSHEYYGKKADINCVGSGDRILICMNSGDLSQYVLCDFVANDWVQLPNCSVNGEGKEFMSAFSFEPRIEACV
ncbi:hypothetical protein GIB67_013243 [Kingdonia uniflora]|uniref:F-box domain-containing protein n=1 Tax=Kingdonia uniflora TaxID=39325 RepID=A0A7J7NTM9_9MAGN|nr:hypothetical protein GIB67_013243 [Kingdonia uniflora]